VEFAAVLDEVVFVFAKEYSMKMTVWHKVRSAAFVLAGGMVLAGGCLPNDFWYRSWDYVLTETATAAYNAYVLAPLFGAIGV
jgi:hypothetical protein